jgi:hypothetical protein
MPHEREERIWRFHRGDAEDAEVSNIYVIKLRAPFGFARSMLRVLRGEIEHSFFTVNKGVSPYATLPTFFAYFVLFAVKEFFAL